MVGGNAQNYNNYKRQKDAGGCGWWWSAAAKYHAVAFGSTSVGPTAVGSTRGGPTAV